MINFIIGIYIIGIIILLISLAWSCLIVNSKKNEELQNKKEKEMQNEINKMVWDKKWEWFFKDI